jgi:tRNA-dihydrouridine synthase B
MLLGLAPMDGYTDCAFRQIVKEVFDKYWEKNIYELWLRTEFMNADGYVINPIGVAKHLLTDKDQKNVTMQIFWSDEKMLTKCFKDIEKKYKKVFSYIELNMGCPARNVMNTWWGSALMKDRKKSLEILKVLHKAVKMPFSIKTRIGLHEKDRNEQMKFLIEASNYVDMISVHGRSTKQIYSGDVDWKFIYELKKQANKKCIIIGNGGIKQYEDIETVKWNLDGIMIGQAAIGNPRIFTPHIPNREEIKETILKHLNYTVAYEQFFQKQKKIFNGILEMPNTPGMSKKNVPQMVVVEFRKHLFQYLKWIPWSKDLKQKLSSIIEYTPLVKVIQEFFT